MGKERNSQKGKIKIQLKPKIKKIFVLCLLVLTISLIILNAVFFLYTFERLKYVIVLGNLGGWITIFTLYIIVYVFIMRKKKPFLKSVFIGVLTLLLTISFWVTISGYLTRIIAWPTHTTISGLFLSLILNIIILFTIFTDRVKVDRLIALTFFLTTFLLSSVISWIITKNILYSFSFGGTTVLTSGFTELLVYEVGHIISNA